MRYGFTTGSCAAAASKGAAYMLLSGNKKETITIQTPKGIDFHAQIEKIIRKEKVVSCSIKKDGGDDPDVTSGAYITSTVFYSASGISIQGGKGVGIVTKPGLDQKVGEAAINHVPREMIQKEVREVCELFDYKGGLQIEISVENGEEIAKQTFNPRLGIVGGISILGTSGIVEPMSSQAILDTIQVELNQQYALGKTCVAIAPGNYGLDFMKQEFQYDLDQSIKCSNFIGETLDMARSMGIQKILLTGHIGKLIKVSGGILNTHSKMGDCRMELLASAAILNGCSLECAQNILKEVNTEEGLRHIFNEHKEKEVMNYILEKILFHLRKRATSSLEIECIVYSNVYGLLGKSERALSFLEESRGKEA